MLEAPTLEPVSINLTLIEDVISSICSMGHTKYGGPWWTANAKECNDWSDPDG